MSMYELHYIANASEQARLKEQQKTMMKALQDLSITAKLQQQQESEKLLKRQQQLATSQFQNIRNSTSSIDSWYTNQITPDYIRVPAEYRPYSPYTHLALASTSKSVNSIVHSRTSTSTSTTSSLSPRQRTPSMSSEASSFISENSSKESIKDTPVLEERDQYGFKRPVQWVKATKLQEFDEKYKIILQKQSKTWSKLFANCDEEWPSMCPELIRYVRNGIPQEIRSKAWLHYSGADRRMKENPGIYEKFAKKAEELGNSNEYALAIERDLHRTFPDNTYFAVEDKGSNEKLQMLRRVLLAFSVYSEIGYCQSFNFLAGFILLFEKEEQTFWLLVTMTEKYYPKNMFDKTMAGANIEQTVLMMMIYEKMPGVWAKIASNRCFWEYEQTDSLPPITLVTNHWFLTMSINILPVETVLRVWDCFFVGDGYKVLYQVALTIFKLNEMAIWDAKDSVDTLQILQNMPRRLVDCHEFMKSVFSPDGIAHDITTEDINRKRELYKNRHSQRRN